MEVRQRPRPTNEQWFDTQHLQQYLAAFGDDPPALPETIRVLDTIAVDYIIETCYEAHEHAQYANRQKVKVDDFQFLFRDNPKVLGRIQEMNEKSKDMSKQRKINFGEEDIARDFNEAGEMIGEDTGVNGVGAGKKGKRGRKPKKRISEEGVDGEEGEENTMGQKKGKKRRKNAGDEGGGLVGSGSRVGEDDLDLEDVVSD